MSHAREAFRTHPERAVDDDVYQRLLRVPDATVIRQYRGWLREGSSRAALIPDFLVIWGDELLIVEVKARRATRADARQVDRYLERAVQMPGFRTVEAALVAPSFSPAIPAHIDRWYLD